MSGCWSVLADIYGFSHDDAKKIIIKCPRVLSSNFLLHSSKRVQFLQEELGLILPFSDAQKIILKFPQILYLDVTYFLIPNVKILRNRLQLNFCTLSTMISQFPQLLGLNPKNLDRQCVGILQLLSGSQDKYLAIRPVQTNKGRSYEPSDTHTTDLPEAFLEEFTEEFFGSRRETEFEHEQKVSWNWMMHWRNIDETEQAWDCTWMLQSNWEQYDLLADTLGPVHYDSVTLCNHLSSVTLSMSFENATSVIRQLPNLLSYRLSRSCNLLLSLKVTLNMTSEDLTKCVKLYPRMFSLSVDAKIRPVLQILTDAAIHLRNQECKVATDDDCSRNVAAIIKGEEVRAMLREVLLKYPHVLGTSLDRLHERFEAILERRIKWLDIINLIRRTDTAHNRWLTKFDQKYKPTTIDISDTLKYMDNSAGNVLVLQGKVNGKGSRIVPPVALIVKSRRRMVRRPLKKNKIMLSRS